MIIFHYWLMPRTAWAAGPDCHWRLRRDQSSSLSVFGRMENVTRFTSDPPFPISGGPAMPPGAPGQGCSVDRIGA